MLDQKKKVDRIFIIIGIILLVLQIFVIKSDFVFVGYMIGFIVVSSIMYFDIKRFEKSINMKIVFNLGIHMLVYGVTLYLSMQISDVSFIATTLALLAYRYVLLFMLKGKVE